MKKGLTLRLVLLLLLLAGMRLSAQTITVTSTNTASICYNDGTLTVNATGGTGPYSYTILSGPSGPNLTYPITLAPGNNTFVNLPHGTFSVQATDATGNSTTVSAVVGGTYQFPFCTATQSGNTIVATASGGSTPFQYALSNTGPNSGFGAYQSSNIFSGMCPGTYWVRALDACGNIYTTNVVFNYGLNYSLQCVNFSKGTLSVTASGGHGTYTYSIGGQTNQTGIFTGLTPYFNGLLTITDSCGKQDFFVIGPGSAQFAVHCPFDSSIYLSFYVPTPGLTQNGNFTYICTNCTPVQTVTNPSGPLFQHINYNQTYDIEVISPACGVDTLYTSYTPVPPPSSLQVVFRNCNSFTAQLYSGGIPINPPNIDSFVLQSLPAYNDVEVNQTGIFNSLPDGTYYLTAYSSVACTPPAHTMIVVPHLPGSCTYMMKNAACQTSWEFSIDSVSPDRYTMVYAPGDTVPGIRAHNGLQALINFYNVQPGTHTLISDSGCVWSLNFDSIPVMGSISYSSISCGGAPSIYVQDTPQSYCSPVLTKIYYGDSLVAAAPSPVTLTVRDSGWYYYKFYAVSYTGDTSLVMYDTICPLDTGAVYVGYGSLPYPSPATLYECGVASLPQYNIYGGEIPYTVEIPGYDTVVLHSNTGIFPTSAPGIYTVIAYDNCGISHSFNFTIVDTCTAVVCAAITAGNDTAICIGNNVLLTSTVTVSGGSYSWTPGTGSAQDTLVSPTATTMYIVTYSQNRCPTVSDTVTVSVILAPTVSVDDTSLCTGQAATLSASGSPAGGSYSWTPGGASTQSITVSPQSNTSYTVSYLIAGCPAAEDSSLVTIVDSPTASVSTTVAICYSPTGAAIASANGGNPPYSYLWSDAAHTTTDTLSGLYPGSTYTVSVSDLYHCTSSASGLIGDSIEPLDIVQDSLSDVSCYGVHDGYISVSILNSSHDSYQWNPSMTGDSVLTGLSPGTYSLTATDPAGCRDTISFMITQPPPVALSITPNDSILKENDSLSFISLLNPYPSGAVSYDWSPAIGLSCTNCAQPVFSSTSGVYHYTLVISYNGVCSISDTVSVKVYSLHEIYVPNAFTPNGDGVNDVYMVYPVGAKYVDLKIFNRWGEKLFESLDPERGWDGKYKGRLQEPGVYVYTVDVTFNDGYTAHDKGSVTLIR